MEVKKPFVFIRSCFSGFCTISLFFITSPHRAPLAAVPQGSWIRSSFHPESGPLFPSAPVVWPLRHINGNGILSSVIFYSWNPKWTEEAIGDSGGKSMEVESEIRIIVSRLVNRVGQHTHKWKVGLTILLLLFALSRPMQFVCAWFEFITIWNKKCWNKNIYEFRCISRFRRKHVNPTPTFSDAGISTLHAFLFVHPRPAKRRFSN